MTDRIGDTAYPMLVTAGIVDRSYIHTAIQIIADAYGAPVEELTKPIPTTALPVQPKHLTSTDDLYAKLYAKHFGEHIGNYRSLGI